MRESDLQSMCRLLHKMQIWLYLGVGEAVVRSHKCDSG